jgi:hypothetical protein
MNFHLLITTILQLSQFSAKHAIDVVIVIAAAIAQVHICCLHIVHTFLKRVKDSFLFETILVEFPSKKNRSDILNLR